MSADSEELVQIVFDGTMTGEFDPETTRQKFARLFRLNESQTNKLFSGKPQIIKRNLIESDAMEFAFKIADAGCECVIEPMPDENDLSLQPGFEERRRISTRRVRFRRGPRPGAIVPDRRHNNGRRKIDPPA